MIEQFVVGLDEVDPARIALVGGKGAQLAALLRIDGVHVPPGFCVTTAAFRRVLAQVPSIDGLLDRPARLDPGDRDAIAALSAELRRAVEDAPVPDDVAAAVTGALAGLGDDVACAVRSSATAEDLPTASFAGQQDTYLNVVGPAAVLRHVSRCWASLFTERAVTYRRRRGLDDRRVAMGVVVQQLVVPQASGVLFTADPVTSHRRIARVEAVPGLGEALVSGRVDPDVYTVRDGAVVARTVGAKQFAVVAAPGGGTREVPRDPGQQDRPALTDDQAVRLVQLGRRIEARLGHPQDIEWCIVDGEIRIVQSRPITTLFPVPEAGDGENHVYVSVGHQQMMTDPMKPLGLSFWQLTTPAPMAEAGNRLFVDVTRRLASPATRPALLQALRRSDPLTGDALDTLVERDGFLPPPPPGEAPPGPLFGTAPDPIETDPAVVTELMDRGAVSVAACATALRGRSGPALFDVIREDLQELRRLLFDPRSSQVFLSAMEAAWWLDDRLGEWLGEKGVADVLTRSVPRNITSQMGLALLDVADAIRPHPQVVALLEQAARTGDDGFLDELPALPGGPQARDAVTGWLATYGMRCVGEIDITRPRWSERPSLFVPLILGNVRNAEPGAAARRFEQGRQEALAKEREVLERLRALPDGESRAEEAKRRIDRVRTFIGYREYPKYGMISRYFLYKQALLQEADRLVGAQVLGEREDAYFLTFAEFEDVVRTGRADRDLIARRREAFRASEALTPPRVLTSDGEAVTGSYRRDGVPAGALVGLPVSAGTVEGRARVVRDPARADLEPGDILVTAHTDPSWTPLFVAAAGLVTEVGGTMTHGAVIAREYGLPAVVSVVDATRLIPDGSRIRVHGSEGYVELLP